MKRREPPPLAAWMLEHLSSGDRDEAIAGDLLEVFRSGRSNSWYWRQVSGACMVSWYNSVRMRTPLFVFALAWSMLAPAWTTIVDRIETTSPLYVQIHQLDWPFSGLSELVMWLLLNLVFLWSGILVYFLLQWNQARKLTAKTIGSAFLKAPGFLLPAYFVVFIIANLFAYPGLGIDRRSLSPLGEIIDLRPWADVLRLPYLLTLIGALWKAVPGSKRGLRPAASIDDEPDEPYSAPPLPRTDPITLTRFFGLMVGAGLINAMFVGVLVCRLPDTQPPGVASLLATAATYVLIGTLAGVTGSWLYWKSPWSPFRGFSPFPFPRFALVCAAGWVWIAPMLLLAEQVSPVTAFAAMIGAFVLITGLRNETYPAFLSARPGHSIPDGTEGALFAGINRRVPLEPHGYIIAIGLYAAGAALMKHSNLTASMWLALSAAVFAWKKTIPRSDATADRQRYRRAAVRLAMVAAFAIIVTAWAMLDGIAQRNRLAAEQAALYAGQHAVKTVTPPDPKAPGLGTSGYESLILWPYPPKKELIAPVPPAKPLLAPGMTKPLILRFDGTYEYVQPPDKRPGPTAHHARGTPLHADIESNNRFPLVMDAHQVLSGPIPTARCSQIEVEIENEDNRPGLISLGLLLADGLPGHERTAYVGQQPIVSTQPDHFYVKAAPQTETVRFALPGNLNLTKFTEITVLVLPDTEHMFVAPRIAIREFRLWPR